MLARASFQAEPLRTGIPETIFELPTDLRGGTWAADGSRVLAMRAVAPPRDASATVVLNWTRLLEKQTDNQTRSASGPGRQREDFP